MFKYTFKKNIIKSVAALLSFILIASVPFNAVALNTTGTDIEEAVVITDNGQTEPDISTASILYESEPNDTDWYANEICDDDTTYGTIGYAGDVDYYMVQFSEPGDANFWLGDIPDGQDYDFYLYDVYGNMLDSSSSFENQEQLYGYPVDAYTWYFIAVEGYNNSYDADNYYRFRAKNYPAPYIDLTCEFEVPIPENASSSADIFDTAIEYLPVSIYTVTNTGEETLVASGTTDSYGIFAESYIRIDEDVSHLKATVTYEDSTLCIKYLNEENYFSKEGEVYSFDYTIDLPSNIEQDNNVEVQLPYSVSNDELVAYALWKNGKTCIANHYDISSVHLGQLILRSEYGVDCGSSCPGYINAQTGDMWAYYIKLDGGLDTKDYLDIDVLSHELGHWVMYELGAFPSDADGSHSFTSYISPQLGYSEGWATFYSCSARGSSESWDYKSNINNTFMGDISAARYRFPEKENETERNRWYTIGLDSSTYDKNQENELNVATALWNYRELKNYATVQSILTPTKSSMKDVYAAAIANATYSEKEYIWNIFNERGCAFDYAPPMATLTVNSTDMIANVVASDNIAVKKIEWYINGSLVENATSNSLDLTGYPNNSTVEVRVYDPEGLAEVPRPREQRYTSCTQQIYIDSGKGTSKKTDLMDISTVVPENTNKLISKQDVLQVGKDARYTFRTDGNMDIYVYAHICGSLENIKIYNPEGKVHDTVDYISPDAPYVIKNAQAGEWTVEFNATLPEKMVSLLADCGIEVSDSKKITDADQGDLGKKIYIDDAKAEFATPISVSIVSKPTKVNCSGTVYTNDPLYLAETLKNEYNVFVYNNGKAVDYTQPLQDGCYELQLVRKIGDISSDISYLHITVDTVAPEIEFYNETETTGDGIYVYGDISESVAGVRIKDNVLIMTCSTTDFGIYIELEPGENVVTFEVIDGFGNKTVHDLILNRLVG